MVSPLAYLPGPLATAVLATIVLAVVYALGARRPRRRNRASAAGPKVVSVSDANLRDFLSWWDAAEAREGDVVEFDGLSRLQQLNGELGKVLRRTKDGRFQVKVLWRGTPPVVTLSARHIRKRRPVHDGTGRLAPLLGYQLATLLDFKRVAANNITFAVPAKQALELCRKQMSLRLVLSAQAYSNWAFAPLGHGVFDTVLRFLTNAPAEHRVPDGLPEPTGGADIWRRYCRGWGEHRIHGLFHVVRARPEGDGTLVVHADTRQVYLVLGVEEALAQLIVRQYSLPTLVRLSLLPFLGAITYDGVMSIASAADAEASAQMSAKELMAICDDAEAAGTVVASLPESEYQGDDKSPLIEEEMARVVQAEASAKAPPPEKPLEGAYGGAHRARGLTEDEAAAAFSIVNATERNADEYWVLRRSSYSPDDDAERYLVLTSTKKKRQITELASAAIPNLEPTILEILRLVAKAHAKAGSVPGYLAVDSVPAVPTLAKAFERSRVQLGFFPPPSPEEEYCRSQLKLI
uniref:Uncharacterized protein n=1 Tax=Phaeomonas parva TaxID=124430 RepID=A0A7S1Y005_9STRA|mmetsp:Transcript_6189/g.17269  ORF Transcript_6189/g.17269 Transcript_6189/m.17269 type:complete len:520 (+) Transcript_6189:188-1747(+)|eukprot:CAMPEP_0118877244 /NCGR_PEP_ID=MMETSP1163-20130328/17610_1 /TAXON_ID=124430 /ORGANISM="Phaeomonas parva, Strain CCMP2877" /LENGTH=519 /DNA_ID=CAMNT_0006812937 /DNA_START=164 /DNA_END=1723 /DNA_ORIENTATION=+